MAFTSTPASRTTATILIVLSTACHSILPRQQSASSYLVTAAPINVGLSISLCIAIDPNVQNGVWWWEAGASGCSSRSTGPDVFAGDQAAVSRSIGGSTTAAFRLGTHSNTRPFIDVRLILERGQIRAIETGSQVSVQPRSNLDIPEMPPGGGQLAR